MNTIPIFQAGEDLEFSPSRKSHEGMEPFKVSKGDLLPPPYRHSFSLIQKLPSVIRKKIINLNESPEETEMKKRIASRRGSVNDADTADNNHN